MEWRVPGGCSVANRSKEGSSVRERESTRSRGGTKWAEGAFDSSSTAIPGLQRTALLHTKQRRPMRLEDMNGTVDTAAYSRFG